MPQPKYLDFDIQISKEGDRYSAQVTDSPAGRSKREVLNWPYAPQAQELLMLRLENAILKGRGYRHGPLTSEEKLLREFGSDLYRAVFRNSDTVAQTFVASLSKVQSRPDRHRGLRLRLNIEPPELAILPWEYMFDESTKDRDAIQNFLCLRNRSPLVRYLDFSAPLLPLLVEGPLRILGMIANPGGNWDLLDTEAERHRIEEALRGIPKSQVQFEWVRGGSLDDLFEIVRQGKHHIFHFIGHGGTDSYADENGQPRPEGFVVMHDGLGGAVKVSASQLGLVLGDSTLRLAVLNCCESGRGSDSLSSVGAAIVNAGVPLAVAMQFAISNGAAARFASMFYTSLVSGEPVERALTDARRFMSTMSALEWGIPVLFSRSSASVLFEVKIADGTLPEAVAEAPAAAPALPAHRTQAQEALRQLFV